MGYVCVSGTGSWGWGRVMPCCDIQYYPPPTAPNNIPDPEQGTHAYCLLYPLRILKWSLDGEVMPFIPGTYWHIDKPFVSPSKRMCLLTKDRKLHSVIMHNVIFANQKTEYCFVSQDTHTCSVWGNMLFRICHWTSFQAFFQHVNCMMGCDHQTEA